MGFKIDSQFLFQTHHNKIVCPYVNIFLKSTTIPVLKIAEINAVTVFTQFGRR